MSITLRSVLITTEGRSESVSLCSLCNAIGHYACIDHCGAVLCSRCTNSHHFMVLAQMRDIFERLKTYRANPSSFEQQIDSSTSSEMNAGHFLETYLHLLDDHMKKDRLLDAKTLADLSLRLEAYSTTPKSPPKRILDRRLPKRSQTAKPKFSKSVTVALNLKKTLALPIQNTFSMGQHPVVVSLVDRYIETFFCPWRENSVILLSTLSVDVYNRSAGLVWSIPLTRILGNLKDRIFAGVWSSYIERLILVGRSHFYVFDINDQKTRCVCDSGCGARCSSGPMRPKPRRSLTRRYRCPSIDNLEDSSARFLACSYAGYLFYGYKTGKQKYDLVVYDLRDLMEDGNADDDSVHQGAVYDSRALIRERRLNKPLYSTSIEGQLAAISITHDRLAVVYRRFQVTQQSKNPFNIAHYLALFDHHLTRVVNDALLPDSICWLTAIVPYGIKSDYLLCDPAGQKLSLYNAIDGTMSRHFRIAPVNACCLTDGRLVLWIQKSYSSSPIGKLHFISPPHLDKYSSVASSFELLNLTHR